MGLLIASVVLSLLLTVEGHKLPHPGLETRVQQHLPHTTVAPSDFHHAVPTPSYHSPFLSSQLTPSPTPPPCPTPSHPLVRSTVQLEVLQACRLVALEGSAVVLCVPVAHSAAVGLAVVHLLLLDAQRFIRYVQTCHHRVLKCR